KSLLGLYILKSETNKRKMEYLGNIFTHYNYTTTDIKLIEQLNSKEISSIKSKFKIIIEDKEQQVALPEHSPLAEWKEARRFARPLPFTFTFNKETKEVLIIEGVRQNWTPNPVKVIEYNFNFLNILKLENPVLANAFIIKNIPYYWKKGKIEKWK